MKKLLGILILTISFMGTLSGCFSNNIEEDNLNLKEERQIVTVGTLKGPTGMGMSYLMELNENDDSEIKYKFEILGAPDQLISKIVRNEVDIAAVPTNLAAILNVRTEEDIQLLGINTLGVLYLLESGESINSIEDLRGKSIVSAGKGAAPEYVLEYILEKNGLQPGVDVEIEYVLEHSEVATLIISGRADVVLLPEPFVTNVRNRNENIRVALDITDEWFEATNEKSQLPMGAVIVSRSFVENNKSLVEKFMEEYEKSVDYVNENHTEAGELIAKFDIIPDPDLAAKAIPNSMITLIRASEMKEDILEFYEILYGFNPKIVGGKVPGEEFFYE